MAVLSCSGICEKLFGSGFDLVRYMALEAHKTKD